MFKLTKDLPIHKTGTFWDSTMYKIQCQGDNEEYQDETDMTVTFKELRVQTANEINIQIIVINTSQMIINTPLWVLLKEGGITVYNEGEQRSLRGGSGSWLKPEGDHRIP